MSQANGKHGEAWARVWLKSMGYRVFQIDWMVLGPSGHYGLVEVKEQERFMAPPFDGHGLPLWQVNDRLAFQKALGVRAMLIVREPDTGLAFYQFFDVLEAGEHLDTGGASPRRIYPLTSFTPISRELAESINASTVAGG